MKIIFIGTVKSSLHLLKKIISLDAEIVGVVTDEDRGINSDYADLVPLCRDNSIPVHLTGNINEAESIKWIRDQEPEVIFCFGWSQLIKKELLSLPPLGVVGYHPAKLPLNRGRHPLIWALALGLKSTASSFFFMDEGADSGDIIDQKEIKISGEDDASSLYRKMIDTAELQLSSLIPLLISGEVKRVPQKSSAANIWRKRGESDGKIDWRMDAKNIFNLVRALTHPYLGAHFFYKEKRMKVWKSKVVKSKSYQNIEPGKVVVLGEKKIPCIKCGNDFIHLIEIEPELELEIGMYL